MTPKQQRFVEEYLIDLNATQAAIRAGYKPDYADRMAAQLLGKTSIQEAIQRAIQDRSKATKLDAEWVIKRLRDESEFHGEGSSHSARVQALAHLAKHLGMFIDKVEIAEKVRVRIVEKVVRGRDSDRDQSASEAG